MEAAYFRFYNREDAVLSKKIFTSAFLTIFIISLLFTCVVELCATSLAPILINDHTDSLTIFRIVCLIPLFDGLIVVPYAKLRMERKIKRFAITRFLLIVLSVFLNAYFVMRTNLGVKGVFLGQLIACLAGVFIFLPQIIKMMDFNINWLLVKDMLNFGLPTLPSNISAIALQVADRPIMKLFVDDSSIGLYQINAKLAVPMLLLVTVFDYAWKPFFLTHYNDNDAKPLFSRVLTYYVLIGSVLWLAVSLFIEYVVRIPLWNGKHFIEPYYWQGLDIVPLLMLGYMINGITTNFAAVFHIEKKTKYLPVAIGLSAVISIVLNFALIPIIGTIGAAISLIIGYLCGAILMKLLQKRVSYKINYEWKRIGIIAIVSIIVFICGELTHQTLALLPAFFVKLALCVLYVALLRILGFFSAGEIRQLKKIFHRR
jgi:O-antigen/teichoic acid export membrane protein